MEGVKIMSSTQQIFFLILYFLMLGHMSNPLLSCSQEKKIFGDKIPTRETTPICDLFDYPEKYNGQTVSVKGTVDSEDPQGTWFYIQDIECRILISSWKTDIRTRDLTDKEVLVQGIIKVEKMGENYLPPEFIPTGIEVQK